MKEILDDKAKLKPFLTFAKSIHSHETILLYSEVEKYRRKAGAFAYNRDLDAPPRSLTLYLAMSVERPDAESDDSSDSDREREAVADLATESLDGDGGRTGAGDFSDHVTDFTDGHMVRKDDSGGADAAMHALGIGSGRQASSSVVVKTTYFLQSDPASAAASASSNQPADGAYQGHHPVCADEPC